MATATKAQLETLIEELQASLVAAEQRINDLHQQIEAAQVDQPGQRDQLEQVVWLQREAPSFDKGTLRWSANGDTLLMRVGYQYAAIDKRTGSRQFGERRWLTVIGSTAEELRSFMETSDTRLVRIGAYERPLTPSEDGTRRSEWILARFSPMPRVDAPASAPQTAASAPAQPSLDEIPF
jgi:hypothetical protein